MDEVFPIVIQILIFAFFIGIKVLKAGNKNQTDVPASPPPAPSQRAAAPQQAAPKQAEALLRQILSQAQGQPGLSEQVQNGVGQLNAAIDRVRQAARAADYYADAILDTLDNGVAPTVQRFGLEVDEAIHAKVSAHQRQQRLGELDRRGRGLYQRLQLLESMALQRVDRRQGEVLSDADAIATAFLEPIQSFAAVHEVGMRRQTPICVPAQPGNEAVMIGLFPDRPVVFVPRDFHTHIFRWMAVPHEIGHVMWRSVPGLTQEIADVGGLYSAPQIRSARGSVTAAIEALYSGWISEIFSDFVTTVMCGPAAGHGMLHLFSRRDRVDLCGMSESGYLDEHPPPVVRMALICHLLARMEFTEEADALWASWGQLHGQVPEIVVASRSLALAIPLGAVLRRGFELMIRLYEHEFEALTGRTFHSIPGFEMGPGLWARARRAAEALKKGQQPNHDGRIVIVGAVEAAFAAPDRLDTIGAAARGAIVGASAPARAHHHRPTRKRARRVGAVSQGRRVRRAELRDAILLSELLDRSSVQRPGANKHATWPRLVNT